MKLNLAYYQAHGLIEHLKDILGKNYNERNAYKRMVLVVTAAIVEKLYKKLLVDKEITLKLTDSEAVALQIILCTEEWPGNDIDRALWTAQNQLPGLPDLSKKALSAPGEIIWELDTLETGTDVQEQSLLIEQGRGTCPDCMGPCGSCDKSSYHE